MARGEPRLPEYFVWHGIELHVDGMRRSWVSDQSERNGSSLSRYWFELQLKDGRLAVVYLERQPRSNHPNWLLHTIEGTSL